MSCQWCEENENIISLCDYEDHIICNNCYEQYQKNYPKRLKGCPYCKGTEEILVITQPLISNTADITVSQSPGNRQNTNECCETCVRCYCYVTVCLCMGLIIKGSMASIFIIS
jgi:hypothetical protein